MRLDIHRNVSASKKAYPFLLNVQADTVSRLATCVVVPMALKKTLPYPPISRLMPEVMVLDEAYVLVTQELAGIPKSALGPVVAQLASDRATVLGALDFLFTGG